ncbi:MAG: hypothetical protein J6C37_07735 [Roseburia sp.]|nr:hypothetical protein [Roseburia sp.]
MDEKRLGKKLLYPPVWVMILLTVFSTVSLVFVFVKGLEESPIAYVIYVISFYTLSVICIFGAMVLPKRYNAVKQKIYDHPLGKRYMTDVQFKNHVSLYCSLGVNLLYVGINVASAFYYGSAWFAIFAVYYTILAVMRFLLVRYINKNKLGEKRLMELRRSRLCAIILTTLNLVLSGAVLMILYQNRGFEYHDVLIYVMAMYTFYVTVAAIRDLIRYRKYNNPILSTSKVIKMAAALVSMLSLETAMFSQFGAEMSLRDQRIMIALTGAGVSIVVITMSIYIIVNSTKEIKRIRRQKI